MSTAKGKATKGKAVSRGVVENSKKRPVANIIAREVGAKQNVKKQKREEWEEGSSDDDSSDESADDSEEEEEDSDSNSDSEDDATPAVAKPEPVLPAGYVCNACKQPGHAIYDCPQKISKKEVKEVKTNLFLSRLPKKWDHAQLMEFIGEAGVDVASIVSAKIVMTKDDNTKSSGVALVIVAGNETLAKVLALNGQDVGGRAIIVKIDTPKKKELKTKRCCRCGGTHDMATCNKPRVCYKCLATDHISTNCPGKK
jgi:hypothetical protein